MDRFKEAFDYVVKRFPDLEWEMDNEYDLEQIEVQNTDYGSMNITIYPDCYYVYVDDEQFGYSKTVNTFEELTLSVIELGRKCGVCVS